MEDYTKTLETRVSMLHKLFQGTGNKENSQVSYEASITLISKPNKDRIKLQTSITYENWC